MTAGSGTGELRVGSVPYLVGRPLDLGLEDEPGFRCERHTPAELVEGLRSGALDVALVSSIELFRRPGYRYLDGLAVAGDGFVGSVQVFLRRPLEAVRTVALDPSSRAAEALVRVLLAGRDVRYVEVAAGADPREADCDAWLRIGDAALREHLAAGAPPIFNPASEWKARTGLPFVFATWIVRPGVELCDSHRAGFARARARGRAALDGLAAVAARDWGLAEKDCARYLGVECSYEPGPDLRRSLLAFRDAAARLDLCRGDLEPEALPLQHVP